MRSSTSPPDTPEGLATPVRYVKGVGPAFSRALEKKGIATVEDALYFLPLRYEDRRHVVPLASLKPGDAAVAVGTISAAGEIKFRWRRMYQVTLRDSTGLLRAKWFHYNLGYMSKVFSRGRKIILFGEVQEYRGEKQIVHPDFEVLEEGEEGLDSLNFGRFVPIYGQIEGIYPGRLRSILKTITESYPRGAREILPEDLRSARGLPALDAALGNAHFPGSLEDAEAARHRLIFDEFFLLELGLGLRKNGIALEEGISMVEAPGDGSLTARLRAGLHFSLTPAQERAVDDIRKDMARPHPMNRLLQGDVGCGKTIVSLLSALIAVDNGYQAAVMAPTEILAEQHYLTIRKWTDPLGLRVVLMTSGMGARERARAAQAVSSGEVHIAVGTHALIQEGVAFKALGLGIIDEQHRFGVVQRSQLRKKGPAPHLLVMTATPIPRTLAMTVYGDLDLTVIDEMPPGRKKIVTTVFHEKDRQKVYAMMTHEISRGRQAFIVYPLVEESDKLDLKNAVDMQKHLQAEVFPDLRVGLLHGRMSGEEKEQAMLRFKNKDEHILVCTTVVEVGIDVPNASIMVVEHAERFGLSQLHQLRGRVGRGEHQSLCFLLAEYTKTDDARKRLRVMEETTDGFRIAEEDLEIRGPGEFFGTRQSGLPEFKVGHILKDSRILAEAKAEAFSLLDRDHFLEKPEHAVLRAAVRDRWRGRLELGNIA